MAEWTLIIRQIKSRPRWSSLYLWEPCLLPVNALLFCRCFKESCNTFAWSDIVQVSHTQLSTAILPLQACIFTHIYHMFMFWEAELGGKMNHFFFFCSFMGITVSCILLQNSEHEGRNNKIDLKTAESIFHHRFSSNLIKIWHFFWKKWEKDEDRKLQRNCIQRGITVDCWDTLRVNSCLHFLARS